ncbi:response regulator transcription factor [Pseudonocardia nematodicida]|uniref:Response regulator transcription factor n=1 Tax=Pseudonocardia nematodicida TaxID=1206997 RepID=A0ABV1KFA7_9PSEU
MTGPVRVLLVDDQALIRSAVRALVAQHPGMEVAGEAADGAQGVALARETRPDVVLMDVRMPVLDGIAATRAICAELPGTRVLVLTTFEEDEYVVRALRAGASGFVGKGAEPDEILRAVLAVHAGESLLSPAATRGLIDRFVLPVPEDAPPPVGLDQLTDREREVLLLVARGRSNAEIAGALVISPLTVKTHLNRTMAKLHAHDRAQLVIVAYESGLLRPGGG